MSNFAELLKMTYQQPDAQRLLFLFAATEATVKAKHQDGTPLQKNGTIEPTMCVDKLPSALTSFQDLTNEADNISKAWDLVFVAGLSGQGDKAPTEEEAEPYLNKMASDIKTGQDLSQYVVFDRNENPIIIHAS